MISSSPLPLLKLDSSNRTDPQTYEQFFYDADAFFTEAAGVNEIRNKLNPTVKIDVDETGCILNSTMK